MPVPQEIGREVADKLFAAERAVDDAISAIAQFQGMLPDAGRRAGLSFGYIQAPMAHLATASVDLIRARESTSSVHKSLEVIQRATGLAAVSYGPFVDKPDAPPQPSGRLEVVKIEAA